MVFDRLVATLAGLVEINGRRNAVLNALIVVTVLVAVTSVAYTAAVSEDTHRYTEFYLLTENESGELVAQDYPESIPGGTSTTFHVGVENHLGERTEYSVVVKLQRMYLGNETPEVLEEEMLASESVNVPEDRRVVRPVNATLEMRGSDMRLRFLLYRGESPEQPSMENAYLETHLWLNVTAPDDADNASVRPPSS
jgi:uncharacterized membrane protein